MGREERIERIWLEKRIKVSQPTLSKFYKNHGIRYIRTPYHISNRYTFEERRALQQEFSLKLLAHWDANHEVVFIDEATCHPWNKTNSKTWMLPEDPIYLNLTPSRGPSTALQGAISNKRKAGASFMWATSRRNNNDAFLDFLKTLTPWLEDPKKTVYVLDMATYHYSKKIKDYMKDNGIGALFLPPSSSALNPIGK